MFFYFPISQRNAFNFTRSNVIPPLFSGKELRPEISICVCTHKHIHTIHVFGKTTVENISILLHDVERVTGRKASGSPKGGNRLQVSDIFNSFKQQEETNYRYFFPSLYKFKRRFHLKYCVVIMTPGVRHSRQSGLKVPRGPTQAPVLITPEEPWVLITVGGQSVDFHLDTGQFTLCLLKPLAHFLPEPLP